MPERRRQRHPMIRLIYLGPTPSLLTMTHKKDDGNCQLVRRSQHRRWLPVGLSNNSHDGNVPGIRHLSSHRPSTRRLLDDSSEPDEQHIITSTNHSITSNPPQRQVLHARYTNPRSDLHRLSLILQQTQPETQYSCMLLGAALPATQNDGPNSCRKGHVSCPKVVLSVVGCNPAIVCMNG